MNLKYKDKPAIVTLKINQAQYEFPILYQKMSINI